MYCTPYSPIFSGAAIQASLIIKELKKIGIDTFVITNNYIGLSNKDSEYVDGTFVIRQKMYFSSIPILKPLFISLQLVKTILKYRNEYDILHFHGGCNIFAFIPLFLNKIIGKKSIFKMTLLNSPDDPTSWSKNYLGFFYKISFMCFDKILSISDPLTKNYLRSNLEEEKLIRIDQAVNTKRYFPVKDAKKILLREKYGLSRESLIIGFTGSLKKRKGADKLVRIFLELCKNNENLKLLIIGEHSFQDSLRLKYSSFSNDIKKFINQNKLHDKIILTGKTNNVAEYLNTLDIFLFPSRREGLPSAVLEAMSSGLPCVIGNMEGIGSYIKGNTESILIPEDERVESYIAKLNDLIDSKELRAKIGLYARQRIFSKFFYKDIAKKYFKIYTNMLRG